MCRVQRMVAAQPANQVAACEVGMLNKDNCVCSRAPNLHTCPHCRRCMAAHPSPAMPRLTRWVECERRRLLWGLQEHAC